MIPFDLLSLSASDFFNCSPSWLLEIVVDSGEEEEILEEIMGEKEKKKIKKKEK